MYVMKLSIVTATYNAMDHLPNLVASLRAQECKEFEWVVADGVSTDGTVEYLKSLKDINLKLISEKDFGIYDALNKAIEIASGDYYLVVGADDILFENAVNVYTSSLDSSFDLITANIEVKNSIVRPKKGKLTLHGMASLISGHAVGVCIKKSLHSAHGFYVKSLPICADQLFIGMVCKKGGIVKHVDTTVGKYGVLGFSGTDTLGMITEFYRVQVMLGYNKYIQSIFLMLRIFKNLHKV